MVNLQMKSVLERGGGFSGINRKVQLKPLKWDAPAFSNDELQSKLKLFSPLRSAVSPAYSPNISQPGTPATGGAVPAGHPPSAASQNPLRRSTTQEGFPRFDLATPTVSAPSSPTRDPERVVQALLILKVNVTKKEDERARIKIRNERE
jgi:hypothetical protein